MSLKGEVMWQFLEEEWLIDCIFSLKYGQLRLFWFIFIWYFFTVDAKVNWTGYNKWLLSICWVSGVRISSNNTEAIARQNHEQRSSRLSQQVVQMGLWTGLQPGFKGKFSCPCCPCLTDSGPLSDSVTAILTGSSISVADRTHCPLCSLAKWEKKRMFLPVFKERSK